VFIPANCWSAVGWGGQHAALMATERVATEAALEAHATCRPVYCRAISCFDGTGQSAMSIGLNETLGICLEELKADADFESELF
jgi:hypothetical protein